MPTRFEHVVSTRQERPVVVVVRHSIIAIVFTKGKHFILPHDIMVAMYFMYMVIMLVLLCHLIVGVVQSSDLQ